MKVNKAIIIGEVSTQPELIQSEDGPYCEFQMEADGEFFHVKAAAKRAEIICKYYRDRMCLYVEGEMATRQGVDVISRETTIIVNEFQFIGAAKGSVSVPY